MGESIHDDIWDRILVRLGVKDLTRCKKVCKSWKSLISLPSFVKAHYTRQVNLVPSYKAIILYQLKRYGPNYYMVGSSNGLACINSFDADEIIVVNPWTREERMLQKPICPYGSCWGFGYDSLTNDYKVVFGAVVCKGKTVFHVLSLKSNVWKHVGHVNYSCFAIEIGTLCNGVLHWFMHTRNQSVAIISFDLSQEVFKEIHQPDDAIRECRFLAIGETYGSKFNDFHGTKISGFYRFTVKIYWKNTSPNYYKLRVDEQGLYTFIPATLVPSLISPHLQEGSE